MPSFENDIANGHLLQAAKAGDLPGVQDALERGARINKTDRDGNTALMISAMRGDVAMFDFLIKKGAAVDFLDNEGSDALMLAISARQAKIAKMCLSLPFNLAAANEKGKTAYLLAAEKNLPRIMTDLEKQGADITAQDKTGATALMLAADNKDGLPRSFVRLLRHDKVALEAKDKDGRTVLMRQLNRGAGAADRVCALLKSGADVSQLDYRQQSVKDMARTWGMEDLVDGAFENYDIKRLTKGSGRTVPLLKKIQFKK
jgi:ankyrin repeat protein